MNEKDLKYYKTISIISAIALICITIQSLIAFIIFLYVLPTVNNGSSHLSESFTNNKEIWLCVFACWFWTLFMGIYILSTININRDQKNILITDTIFTVIGFLCLGYIIIYFALIPLVLRIKKERSNFY